MELEYGPEPTKPAQGSATNERIQALRLLFHFLGALVSAAFAARGVFALISLFSAGTFEAICHWVGDSFLCVTVGLILLGLDLLPLFEAIMGRPQSWVRSPPYLLEKLDSFASFRLLTAVIYAWLGFYAMGFEVKAAAREWETIGRVLGIVAWLVAVGGALVTVADRTIGEGSANNRKPKSAGRGNAAAPGEATTYGSYGDVADPELTLEDNGAPPGGWATTGDKPFGCR